MEPAAKAARKHAPKMLECYASDYDVGRLGETFVIPTFKWVNRGSNCQVLTLPCSAIGEHYLYLMGNWSPWYVDPQSGVCAAVPPTVYLKFYNADGRLGKRVVLEHPGFSMYAMGARECSLFIEVGPWNFCRPDFAKLVIESQNSDHGNSMCGMILARRLRDPTDDTANAAPTIKLEI
ncbi:hypothetical protein CRV169 [Nile crocodilepox virus]|uniref:Uncharacterized protein n=1 Tax=Nile crocodilepox virus (isolate Crocodylus niloticus/Zimbabwe/Ume/2001) TaxID=1289473 RepID=Q06ZY2_CPRVZ|nr:hypothetical protein CRV169 [Nile crocodilepox virus]ABJ09060.1 hypothetical protein CRV169 [Nile crocodilepox virus]